MGAHDESKPDVGTASLSTGADAGTDTGAGAERGPDLSADVVEAIVEVRGQLGVVHEIDPASTALVVIDMQNFFLAPGSGVEVPAARDIVDNINRLAVSMRSVGGAVVWIRMTFEPNELADNWTAFLPVNGATKGPSTFRDIEPGQPGHELWPLLDVGGSDLIVDKRRFSAFIQGSSDLQELLDERGIDTLIIVGTLTNVCCESTARDAMMLNYRVIMIDDGTATISANAHRAALDNVAMFFGEVQTTDHVVDMLASGSARTA
jgi:ureidoacrylate peracid hydrolase